MALHCIRNPLPVAVIGRELKIEQFFGKVSFAPTPVDEQVVASKAGHYHPYPVVHKTCGV
jgi:hypothetical protein